MWSTGTFRSALTGNVSDAHSHTQPPCGRRIADCLRLVCLYGWLASRLSLRAVATKAPLSAPRACGISVDYNFTQNEISAFSASDKPIAAVCVWDPRSRGIKTTSPPHFSPGTTVLKYTVWRFFSVSSLLSRQILVASNVKPSTLALGPNYISNLLRCSARTPLLFLKSCPFAVRAPGLWNSLPDDLDLSVLF